ncbi:MAG: chorismate-binding protein, partial [Coxiellaceae bacterium]|nr:chorismate-binding protein [Coxiellaceae bacterium]
MRITSLPYHKNSAELFSRIAHRPYAIFLDSGHPHYADTRFDIMSAEPSQLITDNNQDPFQQCKQHLRNYAVEKKDNFPTLPFTIGVMGYFSYDAGRLLEKLPAIAKNDIDLPTTCVGFYEWSIVVDHYEQKTWLITLSEVQENKVSAWLNEKTNYQAFSINKPFESNLPFERYQDAFQILQQHIQDGDCYEANLCQRFSSEYQGAPWHAYEKLRQKNPAPYSAFFNLESGAILSFSPERFIALSDNKAETKPIKGTRPRDKDPEIDQHNAYELLHSEKDKAENLMIVDLLRNDFGKCCVPGSIHVPSLFSLESFRNVHHLVSTV